MADYVVIGGGSSGGVIASRLSENPDVSVCLLEAGGAGNSPLVSTPGAFAALIQDFRINKLNWRFNTEPNTAINGRSLYQPRGKMLGGSSGMNGMVYIRGDRSDYDHWAQMGNDGWSYDDVLPYFRRAENNARGADTFHGDSGPLQVADGDPSFEAYGAFIEAATGLKHELNPDFNGALQEGVGFYQFTVKDGKRAGVKRCYIDPAMKRPNLQVEIHARVRRIVFDDNLRAIAVEYEQGGIVRQVPVEKEVIVSGGAFNSPQVLMLSGIGPRGELEKHGIPVLHDLPGVGQNLHDHPDVMLIFESKKRRGIALNFVGTLRSVRDLYQYVTRRGSWLANPPTAAGGFFRSDPRQNRSDFQLHVVPIAYRDHARDYRLLTKWGYSIILNIGRPKSRGSVSLHDADPASDPRIDLNLLNHPDDLKTLRNAFRVTQEILHSGPMQAIMKRPLYPDRYLETDEEIDEYLLAEANHAYHPVGTCKMGKDELAVVDDRLRVHGLSNVRVADASIMPSIVNGNTNAACIMIGEKTAHMIRAEASVI
ncbi:MAG: choline dehydrogenase [Sphingomicrobium sp.]